MPLTFDIYNYIPTSVLKRLSLNDTLFHGIQLCLPAMCKLVNCQSDFRRYIISRQNFGIEYSIENSFLLELEFKREFSSYFQQYNGCI